MTREKELILSFQLNFVMPQPLSKVQSLAKASALETLKEKGIKPEDAEIVLIPSGFEKLSTIMAKLLPPFFPVGRCTVNVYSKS
ncbi:hypothetical protein [Desulfobotulus mexicanus]|uniref:Uncharacterized protein n=1 Tax=Desulfobotulus mexicanus TaxID=2586642 RepID=A0A5S5MFG2_9BACT|nr:hypothetical protein [Desulfobotulus mexicanus]TYT74476.1 hypothetical protein FIM25_10000 [Desulfobotulus mexicanus]